ncbi:MAG: hypothetical protein MUE42_05690 [Opitutaceae bacterium]|jgi:hypothetical protein|nr:hypothetical protein [Opitutaceae bacterium]
MTEIDADRAGVFTHQTKQPLLTSINIKINQGLSADIQTNKNPRADEHAG